MNNKCECCGKEFQIKTNKKKCNECKKRIASIRHYGKKGIVLDYKLLYDTYSITEWYELLLSKKIKKFPFEITTKENYITLLRYVAYEKYKFTTKKEILKIDSVFLANSSLLRGCSRKISSNIYLILQETFPEHNIKPWQLPMTPVGYFKDENNIIEAIDYVLEENNIEPKNIINSIPNFEDFFTENKLVCLITKYFKGTHELLEWYLNKKDIDVNIHSFKIKSNGYWNNDENLNFQMKKYVTEILNEGLVDKLDSRIGRYLTKDKICERGYSTMFATIRKYKHYNSIQECFLFNFPNEKITLSSLIPLSNDGETILDSYSEKDIFDFVKFTMLLDIKSIGKMKKISFYNDIENEKYYPDFVLKLNNDDIFIEYYGLYREDNVAKRYTDYVAKTKRKNKFYHENNIKLIELYPEDLKNNFQGVSEKITPYLNIERR